MTIPLVTVLSTPPSQADPTNFNTRADTFLGELPTFGTELNTSINEFNTTFATTDVFVGGAKLSGTSTSSITVVSSGTISFTTQTALSYMSSMYVAVQTSDRTKWMNGWVTSYSSSTGAMQVDVIESGGSGSATSWYVNITSPISASRGANSDITSMTGLSDDGIPLAKVANAASDGANSDITSLTGLTTALGVTLGGTGLDTYASGDIIYATGSGTISTLSAGTDTHVLTLASGVPGWAENASLPLAGGTMTGDIQLGETSVKLDATLSADGTWSGITTSGLSGVTTMAIGDLIYLNADDSRWELVDANLSDGYDKQLGIALTVAADGAALEILLYGKVRSALFPAFTVGSPLYVSETAGDMTHTAPTTSGVAVRVIGFALTAEDMMFNPSQDYITVA